MSFTGDCPTCGQPWIDTKSLLLLFTDCSNELRAAENECDAEYGIMKDRDAEHDKRMLYFTNVLHGNPQPMCVTEKEIFQPGIHYSLLRTHDHGRAIYRIIYVIDRDAELFVAPLNNDGDPYDFTLNAYTDAIGMIEHRLDGIFDGVIET